MTASTALCNDQEVSHGHWQKLQGVQSRDGHQRLASVYAIPGQNHNCQVNVKVRGGHPWTLAVFVDVPWLLELARLAGVSHLLLDNYGSLR